MLIIAIPKSASTSLLDTLAKMYGFEAEQVILQGLKAPSDLNLLHKYHSDIREYSDRDMDEFCKESKFYKQHIPPTENNKRLLKGFKKVILLRDPKEIIEAYWRAERKKIHKKRTEFNGVDSVEGWINRAEEIGLLEDLNFFYDGWNAEEDESTIKISYNDITQNTAETIQYIEMFFGLKKVSNYTELSKKRYSRNNKICDIKEKLVLILNKFKRRFI